MLRLRPLKRFSADGVHEQPPTAAILQPSKGDQLIVDDAELLRSGLVVTRHFKFAARFNGRRIVLVGPPHAHRAGSGSEPAQVRSVESRR